jgi:transposase
VTATWNSREELVHQIITLARQKTSNRAIARALGVSRNTVKVVLATQGVRRQQAHSVLADSAPRTRAPRESKLDPFRDRVLQLPEQYPDITAQRIFERLRDEAGFAGSYTAVKSHVRRARPSPKPEPSLTTPEYGPGQMAESDWSPYVITYNDGKRDDIDVFSYVLPHSTRKFYARYTSCDLHALMDGHTRAFARFRGCAHQCKYDSQKPVVLRWEGRQPIYNPRFLAFATHYEFRPAAVRGDPNAKPRVERGFWEFERSFLNGRSFRNRDDFDAQLADWLERIVDQRRRFGTTALERFAEEQPHLLPLPAHPYDTARVAYRLCSIDGFVDWQSNRYAVPYDHVTDLLPVRVTERELFVYAADLRCIARYELAPRGAGLKLDPNGLHPRPGGRPAIEIEQLRDAFEQMGEQALEFFTSLSAGPPRSWSHVTRRLLLLRERYATDDLNAALGHAVRYGALSVEAVERILAARHRPRTLDEYVAEETALRMDASLGESRAGPRDLDEYDRLPVHRVSSAPTARAPGASDKEQTSWPDARPTAEIPEMPEHEAPQAQRTSSSTVCDDTSSSSD